MNLVNSTFYKLASLRCGYSFESQTQIVPFNGNNKLLGQMSFAIIRITN